MATIEPLHQHDIDFAIEKGEVDTFIVAFTDIQGRLQGTRISAPHYTADVASHGEAADLGRHFASRRFVDVGDDHTRATRSEAAAQGSPDSTSTSGDDRDLASDLHERAPPGS